MTGGNKMAQSEREIRRLLCIVYSGGGAYMDDGEASDCREMPFIDFLRDTPQQIEQAMRMRSMKRISAEFARQAGQSKE